MKNWHTTLVNNETVLTANVKGQVWLHSERFTPETWYARKKRTFDSITAY